MPLMIGPAPCGGPFAAILSKIIIIAISMSSMDHQNKEKMGRLMDLMNNDNFSRHCGMEVIDVSEGASRVRMDIRDEHLNFFGTVHGGALFSLADMALGAASNSHGLLSMAINCSIQYVKAARKGTLVAEATEVSINPRLATYNIFIFDDEKDVVASFQGMVYRKKDEII